MRLVRKPKKGRLVRVPVVMQMDALECGAASLAMILAYYDRWISLEQLREECGVSRNGSNAKNMLRAAKKHGLVARGYRMEPEELRQEGTFPCVVHWEFNHFIVVRGFKRGRVYVNDPARGDFHMSEAAFDAGFTGVCLFFEPGEDFETFGTRTSILPFVYSQLRGEYKAVLLVAITVLITTLTGLFTIGARRFFVDQILSGRDADYLFAFTVMLFAFWVIEVVALWIGAVYAMRIRGKLASVGSASFMWQILRLPMSFFMQRMEGDIRQRQTMNETVAEELVQTIAPLFLHSAALVVYLVAMLRYSPVLTAVGMLGILCNLLLARVVSAKRINITRALMRDESRQASSIIGGIRQIESLKASGAEAGFFAEWAGYQAAVNRDRVRYRMLDASFGSVVRTITILVNVCVFAIGVYYVIQGAFSVGMLIAFTGFLEAFLQPAQTIVESGQTIQEMRSKMERIRDVMEYPLDDTFVGRETADSVFPETISKLSGEICLSHVTFGYSKMEEPLLKDICLSVKAGSRVALVGSTGCGKSTVANLLLGLYRPWSGEILYDGKRISQIDRRVFTGSVAAVDQDIILYGDTIQANLKTWDESIEDFEVILAARDASIHEEIMQRPDGYLTMLSENGRNFSGGQRQRLEIARVLAQDPTIVIMDEATSALDAGTEAEVVEAIKARGITCIMIAHRLSTVRDCDAIFVMQDGKIVETGTHDQLMHRNGLYQTLVSSDE